MLRGGLEVGAGALYVCEQSEKATACLSAPAHIALRTQRWRLVPFIPPPPSPPFSPVPHPHSALCGLRYASVFLPSQRTNTPGLPWPRHSWGPPAESRDPFVSLLLIVFLIGRKQRLSWVFWSLKSKNRHNSFLYVCFACVFFVYTPHKYYYTFYNDFNIVLTLWFLSWFGV